MTQYLLAVYPTETAESFTESQMEQAYKDVDALNHRLQEAGAWVFAGGLHPKETATTVRVQDDEVLTIDGPFPEAKEHLGGFWIIDVADLDAALEWARQATVACLAPVEVRPFQDED